MKKPNAKQSDDLRSRALRYHEHPVPGKVALQPTKPFATAQDLALAYSPGVAAPCLEIAKRPEDAYRYTSKGNVVAVISNGTAVLGLGSIGALASKPVMEGKAVLFKRFAGIDAIDLEVEEGNPVALVETIARLAPSFGGINLEDIKAPECFFVEEELKRRIAIPVFHDDQHGTAIVVCAAVLNALHLAGKALPEITIVFSGSGAAAIATANLLVSLGAEKQRIHLFDTKGAIHNGRTDLTPEKKAYAQARAATLGETLGEADLFIGLSKANVLDAQMVRRMKRQPIILALANPDPEIPYPVAREARPDAIVATGRSDYPNQANNVLCFPFLFRGALDTHASAINEMMKQAAVKAIASLARERVPAAVQRAYGQKFSFGPEYILPKPFDPRLLPMVAAAVAEAAMESGVARRKLDLEQYRRTLERQARSLAVQK